MDSLGKRGCKAGCMLKNLNCCLCLHCPELKPRRGANSRDRVMESNQNHTAMLNHRTTQPYQNHRIIQPH